MLRACAALLVVFAHDFWFFKDERGFAPFDSLFKDGGKGVDLFFVLSGFIITYIHAADWGRPERIANYVFNRLARIYPLVWIMSTLAIFVYLAGFGGAQKAYKVVDAWGYIASYLLLPQKGDALVGVTWTLKYEIFFYFLFTFCLIRRGLGAGLIVVWQLAVAAVALAGISYHDIWGGFYLRPICVEFGIGMLCALFVMDRLRRGPLPFGVPLAACLLGAATFIGEGLRETYFGGEPSELVGALVFGGSAALIIASLVLLEASERLAVPDWLVKVGDASYAMYLVHYSVIGLSVALIGKKHLPVNNLVCLAVAALAIAAGLLFNEYVDQPLQRRLRDLKAKLIEPQTRRAGVVPDLLRADARALD
jgi:peptidoglycan/LPS O-acetylase OafA/YrhL